MTNSISLRLLWKEYRIQRSFWLSVIVIAALVQLAALVLANPGPDRLEWLFGIALAAPALYTLGCGAVLFAAEHEFGTYELQRALPVTACRLMLSKLSFAVASIPVMIGLLWLLAMAMAGGELPEKSTEAGLWGLWGFATVEVLVWSILFSLVTTRPITAAVLGITAASFTIHFTVAPFVHGVMGKYWETEVYVQALPYRVLIAAIVALADAWLALRWLRGEPQGRLVPAIFRTETAAVSASASAWLRPGTGFTRLVWHHWRQSWQLMLSAWAGVLLLTLMILAASWRPGQGRFHLIWSFAVVGAALIGACTFIADQHRAGYRFLTERGTGPSAVWLSRQLVWGLPALVIVLATLGAALVLSPRDDQEVWQAFRGLDPMWELSKVGVSAVQFAHVGRLVGYVVLAYAAAQLCSILLRSGILAGVFGLVAAGLTVGWATLMAALGVPWLWSVLPIPLILMLVSWLRTSDWLLERSGLRSRSKVVALLGIPAVALFAAVVAYRVLEVPLVEPGFSPDEYARPASRGERETMRLYRQAWSAYVPKEQVQVPGVKKPAEKEPWAPGDQAKLLAAYVAANPRSLDLTLQASRRSEADFFSPDGESQLLGQVQALGVLVLDSGHVLQSQGKFEQAPERYLAALRIAKHLRHRSFISCSADNLEHDVYRRLLSWATNKEVSAKQIAAVVSQIQRQLKDLPPCDDVLKSRYMLLRPMAAGDPEAIAQAFGGKDRKKVFFKTYLTNLLFPWESWRATRVLNLMSAEAFRALRDVETNVARGRPADVAPTVQVSPRCARLLGTTSSEYFLGGMDYSMPLVFVRTEAERRAVPVLLALHAWKVEHGELPPTLDALVGKYLDHVPLDPYTGEPFRYFREGYPIVLEFQQNWGWLPLLAAQTVSEHGIDLPAATPFLWIASPRIRINPTASKSGEKYIILEAGAQLGSRPKSEVDLLQLGWAFPIP